MQYKCVLAPMGLIVERKGSYNAAAQSFADIINRESHSGWKYHSMEQFTITEKPGCGCLGTLLGFQATTTTFYMLVFYNEALQDGKKPKKMTTTVNKEVDEYFDGSIPSEIVLNTEDFHESDVVDSISTVESKWRCGECGNVNEMFMVACSKCGKLLKTE